MNSSDDERSAKLPPTVIFRASVGRGPIKLYVAYLFTDPKGDKYAVLTSDTAGGRPLPAGSQKLDPSRLVEQRDDVSEEPYYLYLGVLDVPQ